MSYAAEKQLADQGKTGRRQGVAAIADGIPQVAGTPVPQTQQQLAGFPVMDLSRQLGLYGNDQNVAPPDTQLAAGPTYLVEADNSALSVWTKAGSLVASADLNVFFFEPTGYQFTDPRILYDTESGRWFLSGLAFTATNDSQVYIAISVTSDPTGSWNVFLIASRTGVLGDQPMTGVSSDKVVISWNDFKGSSPSTATFSGQETWVLQKSDLVSGVGVHISTFGPDLIRFRIVPAQSLTPTTTEWLSYDNAHCPSTSACNRGSPTVGVVAITGTPSGNNVTWTEYDPALQATTVPPNPRQPSGVPVIQDNDDRFISAVWQGGMLWVSGSDGCLPSGDTTTRSCMRLIEISTGGTPSVAQDFDAASNGVDLFYPAVALDSSGDLFIAYSESSRSSYPSAVGVDSLAASPMTFENPIAIASGQTSYSGTRWGDYSGATRDPLDPADVWLTAEYEASALNPGDWGTATARVAIQPSIMTVNPNSGPVKLRQPVTISGAHFQLGATVRFGSSSATKVVVVSSTQITATTPAGAAVGPVNVTVSQPDGTSVTLPAAYTYTRETVSQAPPSAPGNRRSVNQSSPAPPRPRTVQSRGPARIAVTPAAPDTSIATSPARASSATAPLGPTWVESIFNWRFPGIVRSLALVLELLWL